MDLDHLVWFIIGVCATVAVSLLSIIIVAAIGLADSPLGKDTHYVD